MTRPGLPSRLKNLIANPSIEDGIENWSAFSGRRTVDDAPDGSAVVLHENASPAIREADEFIPVDPSQVYEYSLWARSVDDPLRADHYEQGERTILLEGAGTNSALSPTDFSAGSADWAGAADFTITPVASVIAGQTAWQHTNLGTVNSRSRNQNIGTWVAGQRDTAQTIVENISADFTDVLLYDATTGTALAEIRFTWATQTVALHGAPAVGSNPVYRAVDLGNGRWLLELTVTGITTGNVRRLYVYPTGDPPNTQSAIIHYAGLEPGASFASSPIITSPRAPDLIGWTIPDAPHAMEWIIEFIERGVQQGAGGQGVAYLGNDASHAGAHLYVMSFFNPKRYGIVHENGDGSTSFNSYADVVVAVGDRVKFRGVLYGDGSVQAFMSVNGGAEVAGDRSPAHPFAPEWGGQTFRLNSIGVGSQGNAAYLSAVVTDTSAGTPRTMLAITPDSPGPVQAVRAGAASYIDAAGTLRVTTLAADVENWAYLGFNTYDASKVRITAEQCLVRDATLRTLTQDANPLDTVIHLSDVSGIETTNSYIAFNAREDLSDIPNRTVKRVQSVDAVNLTVTLSGHVGDTYPAGTVCRPHKSGATYLYTALSNTLLNTEWTQYQGQLSGVFDPVLQEDTAHMFRPGTAYVRPIVLINRTNPGAGSGAVTQLAAFDFHTLTPAAADAQAEYVHLLEFEFSGGAVRLSTGTTDLDWGGFVWEAVGGAMEIGGVQETSDTKGQGVDVRLSGVDQGIVSTLLTNNYRGRTAKIYRAYLDAETGEVIGTPLLLFSGLQRSAYTVEEERDFGGGTVRISTRLSGYFGVDRVRGIQTNLVSHQHHFAGDTFFRFVAALQNQKIYWGTNVPISPGHKKPGSGNHPTPPIY